MKIATFSILVVAVASMLVLAGCGSCPCMGGAKAAGAVSGDVLDFKALSEAFWEVEQPFAQAEKPDVQKGKTPRLAIVEFTVEYARDVAGKDTGPIVDFGTGMKLELPSILYEGFVELLPEFNRSAVPLETVSGAAAYQRLKGVSSTDETLVRPGKGGARYPAEGLLALDDSQADADAAIRDLTVEVGADVAFQVRLIVGIVDGRAAIVKGSTIRGIGPKATGLIKSKLTLVSAIEVVERPAAGGTAQGAASREVVNSAQFAKAIHNLSRAAIGMALVATGRTE